MTLAEQIKALVDGNGDSTAKTEGILKLLDASTPAPKTEGAKPPVAPAAPAASTTTTTTAPATKTVVATVSPATGISVEEFRKMREELDLFKTKEKLADLTAKANKACEEGGIPKPAITPVFVECLVSSPAEKWGQMIADRKEAFTPKNFPVSVSIPDGKLTVEALAKSLQVG